MSNVTKKEINMDELYFWDYYTNSNW